MPIALALIISSLIGGTATVVAARQAQPEVQQQQPVVLTETQIADLDRIFQEAVQH